jgi:hypothetical protein
VTSPLSGFVIDVSAPGLPLTMHEVPYNASRDDGPAGPTSPRGPAGPMGPVSPAGPVKGVPTAGHCPFAFGPNSEKSAVSSQKSPSTPSLADGAPWPFSIVFPAGQPGQRGQRSPARQQVQQDLLYSRSWLPHLALHYIPAVSYWICSLSIHFSRNYRWCCWIALRPMQAINRRGHSRIEPYRSVARRT